MGLSPHAVFEPLSNGLINRTLRARDDGPVRVRAPRELRQRWPTDASAGNTLIRIRNGSWNTNAPATNPSAIARSAISRLRLAAFLALIVATSGLGEEFEVVAFTNVRMTGPVFQVGTSR